MNWQTILEKMPWEHTDEICFLCFGFAAGFVLIGVGQAEAGVKLIDGMTGAMLMWMKGKAS
jgi:hypothetical protein